MATIAAAVVTVPVLTCQSFAINQEVHFMVSLVKFISITFLDFQTYLVVTISSIGAKLISKKWVPSIFLICSELKGGFIVINHLTIIIVQLLKINLILLCFGIF